MLPANLPADYRAKAQLLERFAPAAAEAFREAADLLDAALIAAELEELDLPTASAECGYSASHLRRLMGLESGHTAKIPNAGTPSEPRIRRAHLPRKPGHAVTADGQPVASKVSPLHTTRAQVALAVANGG